ncbi:hypothetical protein C8F04DRAFT_1158323 [Mycena alexandri]|uniref:Uncharacterized protein n=1 Tax=Mycena alexandri TaxID=1745969 RepID=A0AAD6RXU0_9AGAR|nr:hypothetical protein C8F04DRAFT_1158323 [Mycena alexandri]
MCTHQSILVVLLPAPRVYTTIPAHKSKFLQYSGWSLGDGILTTAHAARAACPDYRIDSSFFSKVSAGVLS